MTSTEIYRIWLDHFPPSENHRFVNRRFVLSQDVRDFYDLVTRAWKAYQYPKLTGWTIVEFTLIYPDRRRRDPANVIKVTMDSLVKAGAIEDDCMSLPRIECVRDVTDPPGDASIPDREAGMLLAVRHAHSGFVPSWTHKIRSPAGRP